MRWLFAVVFPVVLASSTSSACPPQPAPRCGATTHVAPAAGARHVPRNAWIWISGNPPWRYELSDGEHAREIEPAMYTESHAPVVGLHPSLASDRTYTLRANQQVQTWFHVDETYDIAPPVPPTFDEQQLRIVDDQLVLAAAVDDDTAMVRVQLGHDTRRSRAFLTSAEELRSGCLLAFDVHGVAPLCVTLTAIDLAGNESPAARHCMTVLGAKEGASDGPIEVTLVHLGPASPDRDNPSAMIAIAMVIALLVGVFMAFAPEIDMGWLRRRQVGHELLPAAAHALARLTVRAAVLRTALVSAAVTPLVVFVTSPVIWFVVLGASLIVARQLWLFVRARHMLGLLARAPSAAVTLHGDHVLRVAGDGEVAWLVVSPRQLAIATDRVLPAARVVERQ
ncbi:MAG TPA: hypothetical protein VFQ53_41565 [Kofleriaceae bacterium]|nr:hypothetical protein [Kofleriaceae bacterium]